MPVYPIAVLSYDAPRTEAPHEFGVLIDGWRVLAFEYRSPQLNRMHWREYINNDDPVALALAAKMKMDDHRPDRATPDEDGRGRSPMRVQRKVDVPLVIAERMKARCTETQCRQRSPPGGTRFPCASATRPPARSCRSRYGSLVWCARLQ